MSKDKLIPELRFPEFVNEGEWENISIESIGNVVTGGTPSKEESEYWGGDFVWVTAQDFKEKYIYNSVLKLTDKGKAKSRVIPENSVLVTCIASIGLNGINKVECATNQQINSIICNTSNHYEFVYYAISKNITQLKNLAGQTAVPIISKSVFEKFTLQKPKSPKEQQKIASCLSSLDDLIAAHSQKLELLKDHKKGLMQNLFPQEGEKLPKYRFKEFENDGEWVEKKLREVANNVMYGMNAAATVFDGKNIYLRITDIDENSRLISSKSLTSPNGILEDKYLLNEGDLVFARTGASVGKSYLHQNNIGKVYFAGFLIRFSIKDNIPYFIYSQTLTEQYQQWVLKTSMRSGQPGINAEEYKLFTFFIPPTIQEQQKIASCLSSLDALITAQAEKIEQLKWHKKGLMQGLFPRIQE